MTAGPAAYPGGRDETSQRLHVLYERKRYQQMRAGNWAAFTATAPVREHLEVLREAGMTQGDISRQSGVSITAMSRAAKNPRMTTATANALLAVQPVTRDDGQQAAQALRSLVADGWTLQQLANTTGLTVRTIGRTVHGHTTPAPGSTTAIIDALEQLLFEDPGDSASSMRARRRGGQAGWEPVTPATARADLDDVAVDRVVTEGTVVPLRPAEQHAALRRLAGQYPDNEIGRRLGVSARTVLRHRASQGLPPYQPAGPSETPPDDCRLRPPPPPPPPESGGNDRPPAKSTLDRRQIRAPVRRWRDVLANESAPFPSLSGSTDSLV